MTVHEKVWYEVFKRDGGRCRYCDSDLLSGFSTFVSATVDHVLARSAGGSDKAENLVTCCPGCNCLLSRQNELTDFDSRKSYITQVHADRHHQIQELRDELRAEKTVVDR